MWIFLGAIASALAGLGYDQLPSSDLASKRPRGGLGFRQTPQKAWRWWGWGPGYCHQLGIRTWISDSGRPSVPPPVVGLISPLHTPPRDLPALPIIPPARAAGGGRPARRQHRPLFPPRARAPAIRSQREMGHKFAHAIKEPSIDFQSPLNNTIQPWLLLWEFFLYPLIWCAPVEKFPLQLWV